MNKLRILSWNIQGNFNWTGFTNFKKVSPSFEETQADILAIQEFSNAEELAPRIENFKNFHKYIPSFNQDETKLKKRVNQNVVVSRYPIVHAGEIKFHFKNTYRGIDNITKTDIEVGHKVLRIYNCHFPIFRTSVATRLKMLEVITSDAKTHAGPTIICGDLNTTVADYWWRRLPIRLWHMLPPGYAKIKGRAMETCEAEYIEQNIFKPQGFSEVLDLHTPTFTPFKTTAWQLFKQKLDWFAVKNLKVASAKLHEYISDHRALEVEVEV